MSSLLYVGSGDDEIVEHADWVEASTLFRADGTISQEDLARAINVDRSVPQQKARLLAQDAFEELADRIESCGENPYPKVSSYPFELIDGNTVLQKKPADPAHPDAGLLYLFLLFLTRADMSSTGARSPCSTRPRRSSGSAPTCSRSSGAANQPILTAWSSVRPRWLHPRPRRSRSPNRRRRRKGQRRAPQKRPRTSKPSPRISTTCAHC